MRTTVTLDEGVANRVQDEMRRRGVTFKEALNSLIRRGIDAGEGPPARPFRVQARDLGVRPGIDLDHFADLLEDIAEEMGTELYINPEEPLFEEALEMMFRFMG